MKSAIFGFRSGCVALAAFAAGGCTAESDLDAPEAVSSVQQAIATVPQNLCEFTVYSNQRSDIRDRSRSSTGFVGSRTAVELGASGVLTGHIRSGGTILLRSNSRVEGNVTAAGAVTQQGGVVVTGTIAPNTPVAPFTIPTKSVTAGTTDVNVFGGQTRSLAPGNYRDVHAFAGSTLNLRAGVYNVRSFVIEASVVRLNLNITGGPIDVNVQNEVRFGDRMIMQLQGGTNPRQVRYYTNWPNQVTIGTDLTLFGVLTAPNAEVIAFSRTNVRGSLFGRRVTLDTDGTISGACECGNGFLDPNEQCDDGNVIATDACTSVCRNAVCGDGFVRTGVEECDDGNGSNADACTAQCKVAVCGDGFVQAGVEECDDANANDGDACTNQCKNAICGDGIVHVSMEQCDDGNGIDGDACTNQCTVATCGDGIVCTTCTSPAEECDDGNVNDLDSCTTPGAFGEAGCEFRPLRRNIAHVSQEERQKLINAIVAIDQTPAFRYPDDGVSYWDKQDQIHEATHVHGGPAFVPWHRELINRFEKLLRKADPTVALHYWDWTTDPRVSPDGQGGFLNLFTNQTFGSDSGRAGDPFGLLDNGGNFTGSRDETPDNFLLAPVSIDRFIICGASPASDLDDAVIAFSDGFPQGEEWQQFRGKLESVHDGKHVCFGIGSTIRDVHRAFEDPFVYLLHSNVDRLFAMWQTVPGKAYRLDPTQVYGVETGDTGFRGTAEELQPWNGTPGLSPWITGSPEVVVKTSEHASVVRPPLYDTL